jgi:hypothetical protein
MLQWDQNSCRDTRTNAQDPISTTA